MVAVTSGGGRKVEKSLSPTTSAPGGVPHMKRLKSRIYRFWPRECNLLQEVLWLD
jgi:hypothetical protein